ncbi:MAG: peptidase C1 [Bacteroidetes bacterium RIFOXYA12_FULL_35_11]|nr:MAG: peptidase C1 [Bacteroidetes bacterium GWF2_35_48]OFY74682.1 MAG: peptidase C1 [Bacteroidetes bacterium RIFOXYA12_FULL_35_11]OFZ02223.1 MAG: peptidase C1 [Bacteroidetes bacterium RIFOXYC12_FULL_35_7]HBX49909.1 peptidase C1 [Bacteroidales bacterium]
MKTKIFAIILSIGAASLFAQNQPTKNKSQFKEFEPGFYQNSILKDIRFVEEKKTKKAVDKRFQMDMSGLDIPNKKALYDKNTQWHLPPVSQGNTNTCWSFCTISFFESEAYRLSKGKTQVKLSEMFIVYNEYLDKVRQYIRQRGNSAFGEGSEANAVTRVMKEYGAMPLSIYSGLPAERKYHTHAEMFEEIEKYLKNLKTTNAWGEVTVINTVKEILHHYIGTPPTEFEFEGKKYTPKTFLKEYLQMNPDDYADILSYKQEPFWQQVEYKVPDNWWHNADYYNIPLDDYMKAIKSAIRNGYSISIGGDVSEAGFVRQFNAAMIPTFDIPSEYIDDDARQFRFSNSTTTDDHGMHLVGYIEKNGKDWYLIKDSGSGSRNVDEKAPEFGYYFFHEDYVKLKMMDFCVHKDAVKELLKKFGK